MLYSSFVGDIEVEEVSERGGNLVEIERSVELDGKDA